MSEQIKEGGAVFFGLVIGWITSVTFHSNYEHLSNKEIATIIGILGGAAITKTFSKESNQFSMYCVGMFVGFAIHIIISQAFWGGEVWRTVCNCCSK